MHWNLARLALCATLSLAGCADKVEAELVIAGFKLDDIEVELEMLGRLDAEELDEKFKLSSADGVARLPAGACGDEDCRATLAHVYIKNTSPAPFAPPVLRFKAPAGKPRRLPVPLRATEISPGRTGRIRVLAQLYEGETMLSMHLSESVRLEFSDVVAPDAPAPGAPKSP